jgi:pimeloyl-ACP methyl ester carboxylesterase
VSFSDKLATLVVVSLLACTAACQADPGAEPRPSAGRVAGATCVDDRSKVKDVAFGQDAGADLAGIIFGNGNIGVVLAHQNGGDVCQWLPFGRELAERGYRVLLFDFAGFGVPPAATAGLDGLVVAPAAALKANGAGTVVLIGGSMGGTAVLAAAPTLSPPPAAVISYSAPVSFSSTNAIGGMAAIASPILLVAGRGEGEFARAAEQLKQSAPADRTTLLIAESGEHGWALVTEGIGTKEVRDKTFAFLDQNAPAK